MPPYQTTEKKVKKKTGTENTQEVGEIFDSGTNMPLGDNHVGSTCLTPRSINTLPLTTQFFPLPPLLSLSIKCMLHFQHSLSGPPNPLLLIMCSASLDPAQFQVPVLEGFFGFSPNDLDELLSFFDDGHELVNSNSGSEDRNRVVCEIDERKLRRMISNRESARRSRWRKKRHLENLTNRVNRLKVENREFKNRLGLVTYQTRVVKRDNDRLRVESILLRERLSGLHQILERMQQQQLLQYKY
ncbi:hypothetical protein Ancab_016588 [Ancistrocladus abbreviatus]